MDLNKIAEMFDIDTEILAYGNGHINDTYIVGAKRYILQKVNTDVFKDPRSVIANILAVTTHLRDKIIQRGGDVERETLSLIRAKSGEYFYECEEGFFRMYRFVERATAPEFAENSEQMYNAAKVLGRFFCMLEDFDASALSETIVDFHNTEKRYKDFLDALSKDSCTRAHGVGAEIDFVIKRKHYATLVTDAIKEGSVPVRVTHNDTKLNNIMLDDVTGEGVCVIDLDTVMPGSVLYDFGDALRFGASSGAEDEADLDKIWFDTDKFKAFAEGFLSEVGPVLTKKEKELLAFSAKLMCFECGMRFLTDYLNGDTYFKIHRENHNLDRARTQFKLVYDIEQKEAELVKIITDILR